MNLFERLLVYVPVLYLIAIVVMGQFHDNARDTLRAASFRMVRWIGYTALLVAIMLAIEWLFIDR